MKSDLLQKYQWGAMGMREDNSPFGAMYYFRGMDVEDLMRTLEMELKGAEAEIVRLRSHISDPVKLTEWQQLQKENSDLRDLLKEVVITMRHARVFIRSRVRMHPVGIGLYDSLVTALEAVCPGSEKP